MLLKMNIHDQTIIRERPLTPEEKEYNKEESFVGIFRLKVCKLYQQSEIYLNHAPSKIKFNLANQIRNSTLELNKLAIKAFKYNTKKTTLLQLDIELEILRDLWQIFYENFYFCYKYGVRENGIEATKHYSVIQSMLDEIGRMIGGWRHHEFIKNNSQYVNNNV